MAHPARPRHGRALRVPRGRCGSWRAAFIALAIVLAVVSIRDLVLGRRAGESVAGIVYLAITAVVMFSLAAAKRRTAASLGSAPLRSEASLTFLDGILSTLTLTGLALNAVLGWAWADPAAALIVAVAAANEGRENLVEAGRAAPTTFLDAGGRRAHEGPARPTVSLAVRLLITDHAESRLSGCRSPGCS